jgi:hypothetical protein
VVVVFHLLNAAKILIIADALFSWVMDDRTFPRSLTRPLLENVYQPMRSAIGEGIAPLCPLIALGMIFGFELVLRRAGHREPR